MTLRIQTIAIATIATLFSYTTASPVTACDPVSSTVKSTSSTSTLAQATLDTRMIPGERVGAVTRTTNRRALAKLFGESRLRDRTIAGPEGIGKFAATQVQLAQGRSFTVVWSDASRSRPWTVRDFGTAWKTPEGIGIGTSLSELRQHLGKFQLLGLDWDYGGTVLLEKTKLARYNGKLILTVAAAPNASEKYPNDYRAVAGDQTLSSDNPHWKPLGVRVRQMLVVLNRNPVN